MGRRKKITFEKFIEEKKIELRPWQAEAALMFLTAMYRHRDRASGKTFLMDVLSDFINEHGDIYEI